MTPDQINDFFSFLYEGRIGAIAFWLRFAAGIITSALVAAIFVIALKFRELMRGSAALAVKAVPAAVPDREIVAGPWEEVRRKIESPIQSDWNIAVIRADAILGAVLKDMGLAGETLGERLKQLDPAKLNSLNDVWEAHKIRNRIVHETEDRKSVV